MPQDDHPRVLIVDDDDDALRLLQAHLVRGGYVVHTARNGCEAMHVLLDQGPQLVLSDLHMPLMGGLELIRAIRCHEDTPFVYVIALTALTKTENLVVDTLEAGADVLLFKPVRPRELLACLQNGERVVRLQRELERRNREVHRVNAEMAVANARLEDAQDELRRLATMDGLTGLTNRREALRLLESYWTEAGPDAQKLACVILDLDHFKRVNDTLGHEAGDRVLQETARILRDFTRGGEQVARVGGEEFLILLRNSGETNASILAARLRAAIEAHVIAYGERSLRVTASFGVAARTDGMESPDHLLRAADQAMYTAKYRGRNQVSVASANRKDAPPAPQRFRAVPGQRRPRLIHPGTCEPSRLLLVEAPPELRRLCEQALIPHGCELLLASVDDDLWRSARYRQPDVIVLPLSEPPDAWMTLVRRIKGNPLTADVPLLLMTDLAGPDPARLAGDCQADDLASMSIGPEELLFRVARLAAWGMRIADLSAGNDARDARTRSMRSLFEYACRLQGDASLDAVLERTARTASELLGCRRAAILLPDETRDLLQLASFLEAGLHRRMGGSWPIKSSLSGLVFRRDEPVIVNASADPETPLHPAELSLFGGGPLACVPLQGESGPLAVLVAAERDRSQPFEGTDLERLDLVAQAASAAIQRFVVTPRPAAVGEEVLQTQD